MRRVRLSWRCAAGHTLLAVRDLWQSGQFTHPVVGGECVTPLEPVRVEIPAPTIPETMAAAVVDMPQETVRERREERAAWAEWPPYEDGL